MMADSSWTLSRIWAALKKMWKHRGFPKEAPFDKTSQYVKGQMNGFLIGFVAAWEFLHDDVE